MFIVNHYMGGKQAVLWLIFLILLWPIVDARSKREMRDKNTRKCEFGRVIDSKEPTNAIRSGNVFRLGSVNDYRVCVRSCCDRQDCNIVWVSNSICHLIACPLHPLSRCLRNSEDVGSYVIAVRNAFWHSKQNSNTDSNDITVTTTLGKTVAMNRSTTQPPGVITTNFASTQTTASTISKATVASTTMSSNSEAVTATAATVLTSNSTDQREEYTTGNDVDNGQGDIGTSSGQDQINNQQHLTVDEIGARCSDNTDCSTNEVCALVKKYNQNYCLCRSGYIRHNDYCIEQNLGTSNRRCNPVSGRGCGQNELCVRESSRIASCHCKRGYQRDKFSGRCVYGRNGNDNDADTCVSDNECPRNAHCEASDDASSACVCDNGFTADDSGRKCILQATTADTVTSSAPGEYIYLKINCITDSSCPDEAFCDISRRLCHCVDGYQSNLQGRGCVLRTTTVDTTSSLAQKQNMYLQKLCNSNLFCPSKAFCDTIKRLCYCQNGYQPSPQGSQCVLSQLRNGESALNLTIFSTAAQSPTSSATTENSPITEEHVTTSKAIDVTTKRHIPKYNPTTSEVNTVITATKKLNINPRTNEVATASAITRNNIKPTTKRKIVHYKPTTKTVTATKHAVKPSTSYSTTQQISTTEATVNLQVEVGFNRNITLPINTVTVYGAAWPPSPKQHPYSFKWSVVFAPKKSVATISGQHSASTTLSNLNIPGVYGLKLTVFGRKAHGKAYVNVTVHAAPRNNIPPVAVIYPNFKKITLPIEKFVLDGSRSTDDDKIVKYKWELVDGPLNYYLKKKTGAVLELTELLSGTYQFKLTVVDSDGVRNSTMAKIIVHKAIDYKPVANAGPDQILRLPENSATLNGNSSYDDNGIVRYAWTKLPGSPEIADMQGTTSPILHLTNLVRGHYIFQLNVTDAAGQMASATVNVVVQPEDNKAPVAVAGPDKDLVFPDDSTVLDGSASHDDRGIVSYLWRKVSGPASYKMEGKRTKQLKLTKLELGTYEFELVVTDDRGRKGKDIVTIHVKKDDNKPPVAKIVADVVLKLPNNEAILNGSLSSDDFGIASYKWIRSDDSPAIGTILDGSDEKPILRLANLVKGTYAFKLIVTDSKGLTATKKATITVAEDANKKNLVEITVDTRRQPLTMADRNMIMKQLAIFIGVLDSNLVLEFIREINSGGVSMVFYAIDNSRKVKKGSDVVALLEKRVKQGWPQKYEIISIDTYLCHNNCSGHGYCDDFTKKCICNSFWMENFFKAAFGKHSSNCEWSILYVIIIAAGIVVSTITILWLIVWCYRRRNSRKKRRQRFTMLQEKDGEKIKLRSKGRTSSSNLLVSDSEDTEEDTTLFDAKNTLKNRTKIVGNNKNQKRKPNGALKLVNKENV